ncbi:MAG TPA: DUF362 domain-containing protein [Candidatus Bathyarchaeia archaeon]|nr:DUF362 domain-containing protein [Candidatus Bathyarchaeia archaeon]
MSKVSLVKSNQSYQGTLAVLKPFRADLQKKLQNIPQVVIKINFVDAKKKLAVSPVTAVKGFIDFIKPFFKGKIIIAEQASIGNTKKGFLKHGFKDLADRDSQVEVFDVAFDKAEQITIKYPHGKLNLPLAKIYTRSPFVVSITRAKTHNSVVVTLGIKNLLVGAIQGNLDVRSKIHQGMDIHWIMKEIARYAYPHFVVIDGTLGMEGRGPGSGKPKKANFLAAGFDALAVDSLVTFLMGFDIKDVGYLNLLRQAGFGKLYPQDKISIIGPDPKKLVVPFKPHPTFKSQRQWHK